MLVRVKSTQQAEGKAQLCAIYLTYLTYQQRPSHVIEALPRRCLSNNFWAIFASSHQARFLSRWVFRCNSYDSPRTDLTRQILEDNITAFSHQSPPQAATGQQLDQQGSVPLLESDDVLFKCVLHQQAHQMHRLLLTKSVHSSHSLPFQHWISLRFKEIRVVCGCEIKSLPASFDRHQVHTYRGVIVTLSQHLGASRPAQLTVITTKSDLALVQGILDSVKTRSPIGKKTHLSSRGSCWICGTRAVILLDGCVGIFVFGGVDTPDDRFDADGEGAAWSRRRQDLQV
jgi:hypothetical protein